ncbi:Uncharacterised protein [Listeria grayi]|nr:Uncharacterised protein [Listeria grayi]
MPDVGTKIKTPEGIKAQVYGINLLNRVLQVRIPEEEAVVEYELEELLPYNDFRKQPVKS